MGFLKTRALFFGVEIRASDVWKPRVLKNAECIHRYIYIYICKCACIRKQKYMRIHVCVYIYIFMRYYVLMSECVCIYVCVCVCKCTYAKRMEMLRSLGEDESHGKVAVKIV